MVVEKIASYLYDTICKHRPCYGCIVQCSACKHIAPKRYPLGEIPPCMKNVLF